MDLNGVNSIYASTTGNVSAAANKNKSGDSTSKTNSSSAYTDAAATYESSGDSKKTTSVSSKADRSAIIAQLKADSEARMSQMQSLVTKMFQKQGVTIATTDDMWKALAGGNFTADPATIAQAKEDISENGYWGVEQTSERIFSFAKALSGEDESKMKEMVKAFQKGFDQATAAWGRSLPSISNSTYDSVMSKFDKWFEANGSSTTAEEILK